MYLQMDTDEDKLKDKLRRGGPGRRADMTRPLKNRKIFWLYKHWWGNKNDFIWRDHRGTAELTWDYVQTLKPECDLDINIVDAYIELLKVRESISGLEPTAKKFFFNFSFFVQLLLKDYCKNLKVKQKVLFSSCVTKLMIIDNSLIL